MSVCGCGKYPDGGDEGNGNEVTVMGVAVIMVEDGSDGITTALIMLFVFPESIDKLLTKFQGIP